MRIHLVFFLIKKVREIGGYQKWSAKRNGVITIYKTIILKNIKYLRRSRMKEIQDSLKIMLLGILMYIVSFLIIPFGCFLVYSLAGIFSLISDFIIAVVGMKKVKDWKIIFYWLMGDLLYCCLIAVYHLAGLYGIGVRGSLFSPENTYETDMFELMLALGEVFITQVLVGMVLGLSRLIKKWKTSHVLKKMEKAGGSSDIKTGNLPDNMEISDIKSNNFLIKCTLSAGITILLLAVMFLMEYFFGILDFLRAMGVFLLGIISLIAIWSKKHRKGYNTYLYIFGMILFEIILLIMIWSRQMAESEKEYLLINQLEFNIMDVISELVPGFAGAVIIVVLISLVVGLCQLVKRYKNRNE